MWDTRTIQQSVDNVARALSISKEQIKATLEEKTLLKRCTTLADTAELSAFLASLSLALL
jgi:hypothetical protein